MLTGSTGRKAPLVLVAVLLVPPVSAVVVAPTASSPVVARAAGGDCLEPGAPALGVDVARACRAVRSAVPSWRGTARVVLVDGDPDVAADVVGSTVRVHPATWEGLSPEGRQAVLTHELVHVATAPLTTARTPAWLVEGIAESVAWRDVRTLPDHVVAEELAQEVRAHRLPTSLPTERDFATRPAQAYQESWLAVDLLRRRLGPAGLLELYRDAGTMPSARALHASGVLASLGTVSRSRQAYSRGDTRSAVPAPPPAEGAPAEGVAALVRAWRVELVRRLG